MVKTIKLFKNIPQYTGISLSILCGIHCALLPVILLLAPALSAGVSNHFWMDAIILASIIVIGIFTIGADFQKYHRNKIIVVAYVAGLFLMISGHLTDIRWVEITAALAGGCLLAGSQFYNLQFSRKAKKLKLA